MIIQHNMAAVNAMTQLGITNANLRKSTERLSSGYRVNRAADDAAALTISEKKRSQIRGLERAAKNAEDGVGFVQTGDGAMDQMESILHRMRELTIQSLNDAVYTPQDRAAMQAEFDELQSEIDRINNQTEFNTLPVFEHYADTYSSFSGNRIWSQDQIHTIDDTNQSLTIKYKTEEDGPEKEITLTVPKGSYTTQELMDEIDDIVMALGEASDGLYLEYTDAHTCNMVLQDGAEILEVTGGLSYLFFDQYGGSQVGSLIGTTIFDPNFALEINQENNELKFTIEYFDGTKKDVELLIDEGYYTRSDMIDYLNEKLAGTGMTAKEYGDYSIQVGGEDGIITGLKGNMFKIDDEGQTIMISVFYDNTKYGSVTHTSSVFTGGAVLVSNSQDTECNRFTIDDSNNILKIRVGTDDTAPYAEIQLENKQYTMKEMIVELQKKLDAAGLGVTVASYGPQKSDTVSQNGNQYSFYGIKITSNKAGTDIRIDFDEQGSTAYDTLFVKRVYTDEGKETDVAMGRDNYTSPTLTGGRIFGTDNIPAVIDNSNNSFVLHVAEMGTDGKKTEGNYTIRLTEGTYDTMEDIIAEINKQIANGPVGINGKIQAVNYGGAIRFRAADTNRTVTSITFADQSSKGYNALFVGEETTYSTEIVKSSGNPPTLELDELGDPVIIDDTNDNLIVSVGGEDREVTLPHGQMSPEELAEILTQLLKGQAETDAKGYTGAGTGDTQSTTKSYSGSGKTNPPTTIKCDANGKGGAQDGSTTVTGGEPARYTVPVTLSSTTVIDDDNRQFRINVNGTDYEIELNKGSYSRDQLAKEFQEKLNAAITKGADKVTVSLQSNKLVFETNNAGSGMHMQFSTDSSTFLKSLSVNETTASMTTKSLQSSFQIDSSSNLFTMNVDGKTVTVTLDAGKYTPSSFASMLERKLREQGAGVSVTTSGSALRFVTDAKGDGASVSLDTGNCGSAGTAMFGEQISRTPATATLSPALPTSTTNRTRINDDAKFTVQVTQGGSTTTIDIDIPKRDGGYTNEQLRDELNRQLQGKGVSAKLTGNSLIFTSTASGKDVSVNVTGYVTTTSKSPDIEASVDPNTGRLVLQNTSNNATVSVQPSADSAVLQPIPHRQTYLPKTPVEGSIDQAKYTLNTSPDITIPEPTKISDYNKTFKFIYVTPNGGTKNISIELAEGTYSRQELQNALQQKLNEALGSGELNVSISADGINITAEHYGKDYYLSNMEGGFYEYVLRGTAVRGSDEKVELAAGKQVVKDTYIAGRKDVRNKDSKIQPGINDSLSIDVTINGDVYTLEMTLDPGNYNSKELVAQLQKKLDEQLEAAGLPTGLILAGVGTFDTGVAGADDKNSLFFYVNSDIELDDGDYRIDGLGGTALFEIFYKTEGDLIPSYLTGMKDISQGVEILPNENTFTIDVDGTTYSYTIPEGSYTCEEFLEILEKVFDDPNAFLTPSLSGNALKISYEKMGEHTIGNIQGPAKDIFFYDIEGRTGYNSELTLQIGANENQGTKLERFSMSTMSMGINSITISGYKYANKALQRLDGALNYLNTARSKYGAKQNRLEYTIKGNENTAENLQASESKDRDANMADEMVQHAKSQILQQTGSAMLTQANQHTQRVLSLLNG